MLNKKLITILFLGVVVTGSSGCTSSVNIRHFQDGIGIRDDRLYLNEKKFFVNAVGYAPWRPGQWPGKDKVDLSLIEEDFRRIKEIGFNSIRTWDALSSEELALAKKYELKIIQGIWIDPTRDFSDPYFIRNALDYIEKVVQWSKHYDNVLMYLVITEPRQEAVLYAGVDKTLEFFRKIKGTIQAIDNKPVSMDSWIPVGFLDHSLWDVITFNAFMFVPEAINKTAGFTEYVQWFKGKHAQNKPLFIGETGGFSVSSKRLNNIGFGGNTEEAQAKGNIESIKESIAAGAAGVCTVSWTDTWHYPSDPSTHDNHPWEWNGIIGFKDGKDFVGTPRKTYDALKRFNSRDLAPFLNRLKGKPKMDSNYIISILPRKANYKIGDEIEVNVKTIDRNGKPLSGKRINIGFFLPFGWKEEIKNRITDREGKLTVKCSLVPEDVDQYLIVSAGLLVGKDKIRNGDLIFVKLDSTKPVEDNGFFIVYRDKDSPSNHFYPTGWLGDYEDLKLNDDFKTNPYSGKSCIKIHYSARGSLGGGWAGIYWQNPAFNWDEKKGGINLSGVKRLIFWAKGQSGGERIEEIGIGGNLPNSTKITIAPILLTDKWQKFYIDLSKEDLSRIINGFYFFLRKDSNPSGCIFYLDDIKYELPQ